MRWLLAMWGVLSISACSLGFGGFDAYSITKDPNFQSTIYLNPKTKLDILVIMDNSALMEYLQDNLLSQTSLIVQQLTQRGLDFQIAVGLSDAYRKKYNPSSGYQTLFSQGVGTASGYSIVTGATPNAASVLNINLDVGVSGHADVRELESLMDILSDSGNVGLIRTSSHLATVFVTNEDDFSNSSPEDTLPFSLADSCIYNCSGSEYELYYELTPGNLVPNITYYNHTPGNPDPGTGRYLIPLSTYYNYMQSKIPSSNSIGFMRGYSFHAYAIVDHACRVARNTADGLGDIHFLAKRYMEFIEMTGGGILASPCVTPATEVKRLIQGIISENFRFTLPYYARAVDFEVVVAGNILAESSTNGWTFDADTLELRLHGDAIPAVTDSIQVNFLVD